MYLISTSFQSVQVIQTKYECGAHLICRFCSCPHQNCNISAPLSFWLLFCAYFGCPVSWGAVVTCGQPPHQGCPRAGGLLAPLWWLWEGTSQQRWTSRKVGQSPVLIPASSHHAAMEWRAMIDICWTLPFPILPCSQTIYVPWRCWWQEHWCHCNFTWFGLKCNGYDVRSLKHLPFVLVIQDIQRSLLPSFTSEKTPTANSAGRGPAPAAFLLMLPGTQYPLQESREGTPAQVCCWISCVFQAFAALLCWSTGWRDLVCSCCLSYRGSFSSFCQ